MWPAVLLAGVAAVTLHELGHIVATPRLGGRFMGLVFRGLAVGVQLDVTGLTPRQQAATCLAGPLAAWTVPAALGLAALAGWCPAAWAAGATALVGADTLINMVPWWPHNDGARWRALRRAAG